jgi:hypothetical protein
LIGVVDERAGRAYSEEKRGGRVSLHDPVAEPFDRIGERRSIGSVSKKVWGDKIEEDDCEADDSAPARHKRVLSHGG